MSNILIIIAAIIGAVILLGIVITSMYVKAPPSVAFILSGIRKEPRTLIGTGGLKIPFFERLDKVFLGQVTVDVKTSVPVPTHDFIDVSVDAVCKVRALPTPEGTRLAAKNFLNMSPGQIAAEIKDSLEGNMREVVGAIPLQDLVTDRDAFSDQIQKKANTDMQKLGLEILSCNIQNITDQKGLIEGLGADNTYKIRKDASITKANAERDIAIAEQEAKKTANDVRVKTETEIAERNNELEIKKADLKTISDTKKAAADAAYAIQEQEQLKEINVKTVEAEAARQIRTQERQKEINAKAVEAQVEKAKKEQELKEQEVLIKEKELAASIQKEADAKKYQIETDAKAALEQEKREAEAIAYKAQKDAEAIKAKAEAELYAQKQAAEAIKATGLAEAEAIKAKGLADAEAIEAKGIAEAKAIEKKYEAWTKFGGDIAKLEILSKIMPDVAKNVADPISSIDNLNIYGGDGSSAASKISANVPTVIKQVVDTVESVTGINVAEVAKGKLEK